MIDSEDLQISLEAMGKPPEDSSILMREAQDVSASALLPPNSDPEAYHSSFQYIKYTPWPFEGIAFPPSLTADVVDDFSVDYSLSQQDLSEWCEALGSERDPFPGVQSSDWLVDGSVDTLPLENSSPWDNNPPDAAGSTVLASFNPINDQLTPDLTEYSTLTTPTTLQDSSLATEAPSSGFKTDTQRWHATQSRLRAADPFFLYGVLTTKIFCRPSCASRRPSRRHVRFFPFPGAIEAAEKANLRRCKRCNPELLGTANTAVLGICHVLRNIIAETHKQGGDEDKNAFKLDSLAQSARLSPFHFHRLFKATTQITPGDFISACRALALQDALGKERDGNAGKDFDFIDLLKGSSSWSLRTARKALGGILPAEYTQGAPSAKIEYCCVDTPCGRACAAFSQCDEGDELKVHAVLMGLDAEMRIGLRFPGSTACAKHNMRLENCVGRLEKEGRDRDTELSGDVLPALWRARIWLKLLQPLGE